MKLWLMWGVLWRMWLAAPGYGGDCKREGKADG